jgi:hypothetical protein
VPGRGSREWWAQRIVLAELVCAGPGGVGASPGAL